MPKAWTLLLAMSLCAALSGHATSQPAPNATRISPLVVEGGSPPVLASSFPAEGAKVSGGVLVLKLTYDQAMSQASRLGAPAAKADPAAPPCLTQPRLLADGKTYVILCSTKPATAYAIDLAGAPGFLGASGRAAKPAVLQFSTTETIIDNVNDALEAAGLTAAEDPVMTWCQTGETPVKPALDSPSAHP